MADEPFCTPACTGWPAVTNAKYTETGELRDQHLCTTCGRPAKAIFTGTDRWALEYDLWKMRGNK